VRIHNTNTHKIIVAHFPLDGQLAAVDGDLVIPGVSGSGAPVRLEFLEPGGASTGTLLPTGNSRDALTLPSGATVEVSLVDATNACVFVKASDVGLMGTEHPNEIERNREVMELLAEIRAAASVAMGICSTREEAIQKTTVPFITMVSAPSDSSTIDGGSLVSGSVDLIARAISNRQPHRALPLGVSLCLGVAAHIEGSIVWEACRRPLPTSDAIRVGMPSGVLAVSALVQKNAGKWQAISGSFYRTQRRLFEGNVFVRSTYLGLTKNQETV
jgi:2-methylaconitate cis-trans-isomerase PrpF